ncbi:ATP-grasp domain-containing protein [Neokomagataea thailandica]|uniref:D-alanine--D-alanine ligase n=1 Tax=Neokomagataea tanensis NBRC 106556 TaxID=1223519 RepID=A0ABQ0QKG6_9PROT|nr:MULTISPECIES: D-alanine--D-alanine ligase [Neokomagataea]GBR47891.1 D-alanine--D-alanine ligase [Neokomagataea tanensis NBRC 106556]
MSFLKRQTTQNILSRIGLSPNAVLYTPIVFYWLVMGLRYRHLGIATAANPRIETGGLCGESKSSILNMAGQHATRAIAPYAVFPSGPHAYRHATQLIAKLGLSFPVVIKPDIGCNGTGVKCVSSDEDLQTVLSLYPDHIDLMVQKLIHDPIEVGVFYIRPPDAPTGYISSLTYKTSPSLIGDGHSSIIQLLHDTPALHRKAEQHITRLGHKAHHILKKDEVFSLVFTGNYCKGSIFHNGYKDITPELTNTLDTILQDIPDFHFGRIDAKVPSIDALKRGEDLQIIEINGLGAEAIHIWDPTTSLCEAYMTQIEHYGAAFRIGAQNRKRGWKPSSPLLILRAWLRQRRLLSSYPISD